MAILQAAQVCPAFGAGEQALGEVDAGDLNVRVALRETAGIEAGTAGNFQEAGFGTRPGAGPECVRDRRSVIAEQMLTTEGIEPRTSFEEAFRIFPEMARIFCSRVLDCHRLRPT